MKIAEIPRKKTIRFEFMQAPHVKIQHQAGRALGEEIPRNTLAPAAILGRAGSPQSAQLLTVRVKIVPRPHPALPARLADRLHIEHTFSVLAIRRIHADC